MLKVQQWNEADFKRNLDERWARAVKYRQRYEDQWRTNEEAYYNALGVQSQDGNMSISDIEQAQADKADDPVDDIAVNYIFEYVKRGHAMMSANPPDVIIRPMTQDLEDLRSAEVADVVRRWINTKHNLQERFDERNLKTLTKGTGHLIVRWDSTLGDALDFNEETNELVMDGGEDVYSPDTWDIWLSPDGRKREDMPWFFEQVRMTMEEAVQRFPEHEKLLKEQGPSRNAFLKFFSRQSKEGYEEETGTIEILRYTERGMAVNGMVGRHAYRLPSGELLEWGKNPNPGACLGLHTLTDIDVENEFYGKSIIEYLEPLQEMISSLDTNDLANVAVHNVVRMLVDESTHLAEGDKVTDSTVDMIPVSGMTPDEVKYLAPPSTMPDSPRLREQFKQGQKGMAGQNDAMTGQVSRETSGYTMDRSIESGQLMHRRLFNKYTLDVRNVYKNIFAVIIDEWTLPRMVEAFGNENEYDTKILMGSDIRGGWDFDVEYGRAYSNDPAMRRQQIKEDLPVLEKIPDFDHRDLAKQLKLGIAENVLDTVTLAKRRQQEIFDRMIERFKTAGQAAYEKTEDMEKHVAMFQYCQYYYHTKSFQRLPDDLKAMITRHMMERKNRVAEDEAKAQAAAQPAPAAPLGAPM